MATNDEVVFYVCALARLLAGRQHLAVGANSPIPGSAVLLARALSGNAMRVSILGSKRHNNFTGLADLFDCASNGRLDGFFLSPGQIDGQANINMLGIGDYPRLKVRWPGSHGAPLLYMMIPNIILFREEHSRRVLVPRVGFISAPGVSPPNVFRPGGPTALLTERCLFSFQRDRGRFRLESVHPGHSAAEVKENTDFDYDEVKEVGVTPTPTEDTIRILLDRVAGEIAEIYPQFAERLLTGTELSAARQA